jgi:hypothetical protein
MRRPNFLALAAPLAFAVSAPIAASAQGWLADGSLRLAPQMTSYTLDQSGTKVKVSEFAIPIAFLLPISPRLNFDIATAFASATVEAGGKSTISGLTDTQLRLNWSLGADALIITAGLNVPTGQYKVADDKVAAAGQIGNDFLSFPVSSFGNGLAGTGGVALARTLGAWNVGLGASFRKTAEFGAFGADTNATRFQPADEARLRIGVDREAFGGRMTLAAIYSVFGEDACAGCTGVSRSTYSSGDRLIGQVAFDIPTGASQLFLGGWVLHHAAGETVIGAAPAENILNGQVSLGFTVGSLFLEPSLEGRMWTVDGNKQGTLGFAGVRTKFDVGTIQVSPSVSYAMGTLEGSPNADISGFKAGLTIRIGK